MKEKVVMFDRKTIVLPVDFSSRSLEAARQARGIARQVRCRLLLLNVVESQCTDLQFEPGGSCVEELESYLNHALGEIPVEYVSEPGDPGEVIDRVARKTRADLIVMAGHNRGPFEAFALGSVVADVLCSAPCPVWVSPQQERGPAPLFRRILCPVGLSDSTSATLDWALRFSHAFDAACAVIHVAANSNGEEPRRITEDRLTYAEREGLDAVKGKLDGRGQLILAAGSVASVIAAASVDLKSDLLVMGRSRSRDEMARVHSLPFTLARRAACPVVAI
jgi:nucleotide-binding universal stress UspA family protein